MILPRIILPQFRLRPPDRARASDPQRLFWYMHCYDKTGKDHRFQPILLNCQILLPRDPPKDWPQFEPQPTGQPPQTSIG